jgi:hypothetical protein
MPGPAIAPERPPAPVPREVVQDPESERPVLGRADEVIEQVSPPARSEGTAMESARWHVAGDWFDNCSCAVACPCTFAEPPDNGFCESVLFWHIRRGHSGDVPLDGLSFVRVGRWEGDLWAGKVRGTAGIFVDERADERQAEALSLIIGGRAGGFPARVAALFTEGRQLRGVERARITFEIAPDRASWGVEIAGKVKAWARALTGPTSLPGRYPELVNAPGCETGPGPQAVTWGKSTICSVDAFGYTFRWTTSSSKHIPFDWSGP